MRQGKGHRVCRPTNRGRNFTTREAASVIVLVVYVCLSVCNRITFESLDVVHFSHPVHLRGYR